MTVTFPTLNVYFTISEAVFDDLEEITKVINLAYKRDYFRPGKRIDCEKVLNYFYDRNHTWYVLKVQREKTIQIACVALYSNDKAPETSVQGNIHMLSVRPLYWGYKLSMHMLNKLEARAQKDGKRSISLIVANVNDQLIKFYESNGYKQTGKKFQLPTTSLKTIFKNKDEDGFYKIHCLHMEKQLLLQSRL